MGVKSLWSLLEPVGRPVPLENMEGRALAIDSSIWIYQFQATMRDKEGRALMNAHVLGFLRRICKLLFYGIRPVFVFDGGAPALKRNTISERKKKKSGAATSHAQIAERLLAAQMRREALTHAHASLPASSKGKQNVPSGLVTLDESAVYLEDIDGSVAKTPARKKDAQASPASSAKKNRFHDHDPYRLPHVDLEEQVAKATRMHMPDPRLATEEELRAFIEEMKPEDIDVTAPAFRELPTEVQYEIVGDLRLKSRQTSYKRLQNMLKKAETPLDFSKEQIKGLQQRNALTQQLLITTDTIGQAHINIPVRIASERNKEYVLERNESAEGGWVLGLRDEGTQSQPIDVDAEDRVESDEDSDDMDMEEINIPEPASGRAQSSPVVAHRSGHVTQFPQPVRKRTARRLFDPDEDDDLPLPFAEDFSDEDPELATAIQASLDIQSAASLPGHLHVSSGQPSPSKSLQNVPPTNTSPAADIESLDSQKVAPVTRITSDDDIENLYASPSRLETALAIAGAGPLRRASGTFLERTPAKSAFGKPLLLVSPKATTRPLALEHSSTAEHETSPLDTHPVHISEKLSSTTHSSVEELPLTSLVTDSKAPVISVDSESDSDGSMEEVEVGRLPSSPVDDVTLLSAETVPNEELQDIRSHASSRTSLSRPAEQAPTTSRETLVVEESEAESIIEWSRSPSPTGGWSKDGDTLPTLHSEREKDESWDAAQEMDPHAEEGEFARFVSQVKGKDLEAVRHEIDEEIQVLNQQKKAALRDSDNITQHMISQIMLMLRLFGIPYITAPMEAEAQCAELVRLGLVEGIITDDSDVFLFGGLRVYKNMFNQSKTVECFLLSDLSRELGLSRDALVRLAYLLGSDYVEGLPGVGPVVAMELMQEFPGEDGLHKFKEWWTKVQSGRDRAEDNKAKFRKRFKKKFKDLYLQQEWPNPIVRVAFINQRDAYYHPTVDSSEEPFKWGMPDLDALRHFLHEELGWNESKVDELLLPIIQKMNRRNQAASLNKQGDLNQFFSVAAGTGSYAPRKRQAYNSKRLQQVVTEFRKEQAKIRGRSSPTSDGGDQASDRASDKEGTPPKKKRKTTVASRKGKRKETEPAESVSTTAPAGSRKRRGRGVRAGTTDTRSREKKQSSNGDHTTDGSDSEDEFAGERQGVRNEMLPSGPLAVELRPRVNPRVRKARAQRQEGGSSPSDADKVP
ncbi:hypothetical protein ID866_4442 [Astraeus odoratus]|nr:hypothetical protein ID866_4442 [Astraeus odoratus]